MHFKFKLILRSNCVELHSKLETNEYVCILSHYNDGKFVIIYILIALILNSLVIFYICMSCEDIYM
jgi:hypothetical protein